MSDLNKLQKLALAQGLYSKLGEVVSTKTPDSLCSELDERAEMLYRTDGMADVDVLRGFVMRHARDLASLWLDDFGEIPPGFEMVETMDDPGTPAMPERYAGTVLKVDTEKLAMALGPQLPGEVVHILTDGGD